MSFEINYEQNLFELHNEIVCRTYKCRRSICFIVDKPVKREIFAADFRDRIVHHLVYNYMYPVLDKIFIKDSYSCRKGKGTLYGINRVIDFIKNCSENYVKDCYVLKLDIKGYFMSINKNILFNKLKIIIYRSIVNNKGKNPFNVNIDLLFFLLEERQSYFTTLF